MFKRIGLSIGICIILMIVPGCWDLKEVNHRNYVTSIGFDYVDGKYRIYAQLLGFSSIAKDVNGTSNAQSDIWVGHSEGVTINDALNSLYKSSQQQTDWEHVNALLFTERALEKGVKEYLDGLFRFRSIRYTCWVYGTKNDVEEIMTTGSFFDMSALHTVMHSPMDLYKQRSIIKPIRYLELMYAMKEPGKTIMIPSLDIVDDRWENSKDDPKLFLNGIFALRKDKYASWFHEHQVTGIRWLEKEMVETPLTLEEDGNPVATVKLVRPKLSKQVVLVNNQPIYDFRLTIRANIVELREKLSDDKLQELIVQEVKKELEQTIARSIQKKIDLIEFEYSLFKHHTKLWKQLTQSGNKPYAYTADQVKIKVDVNLMYEGRFVNQPE